MNIFFIGNRKVRKMSFRDKFKLGIYNVGIIKKDVNNLLSGETYEIIWLKHGYKDRFFADPFLLCEDELNYHILVEEFCFYENIGKISLLHVDKEKFTLRKKEILIQEKYHMSFPYCDGEWIYPEAYRSGAYYKYEVSNIANKQKVCDEGVIDPIPVKVNNQEWLLTMKSKNPLKDLYLYKKNQDGIYELVSYALIKADINFARPAGQPFVRDGILYRPVQDSEEIYGRRTHLMEVQNIDETFIEEEKVLSIDSDSFPPYNRGLHTFNAYNGFIIVDGYYEKYSYIGKSMYVKFPRLVKKWKKMIGKD